MALWMVSADSASYRSGEDAAAGPGGHNMRDIVSTSALRCVI